MIEALKEEIAFLDDEIRGLRGRIGAGGNAVQQHKLSMLMRLRERCERSLKAATERKGQAAA